MIIIYANFTQMKPREDCAPMKPDAVQHFHNFSSAKLELTQLQAYTEYEVCVYAYNEGGESEKCEVFETLPDKGERDCLSLLL